MRVSVDECPAGYHIDIACAQALGYIDDDIHEFNFLRKPIVVNYRQFKPSTDTVVADGLVDLLADTGYVVSVCYGPGRNGENYASVQIVLPDHLNADLVLNNPREMDAVATTRPLAITRAFLKSRGVEHIEILNGDK